MPQAMWMAPFFNYSGPVILTILQKALNASLAAQL